ncbi:MAG: ORF6N domain-containing protein [Phycisphaerales bacterium]
MYGVPTKVLNQAVARNIERFPEDFLFRLTREEADSLRSQTVTLNELTPENTAQAAENAPSLRSQSVISKRGRHSKYLPLAFTEQGVAMLSSVLRSPRAVTVNVEIMRAFVRLRQLLASNDDLRRKLDSLESKYDEHFRIVFDAIRALMEPPEDEEKKPRIGFKAG